MPRLLDCSIYIYDFNTFNPVQVPAKTVGHKLDSWTTVSLSNWSPTKIQNTWTLQPLDNTELRGVCPTVQRYGGGRGWKGSRMKVFAA